MGLDRQLSFDGLDTYQRNMQPNKYQGLLLVAEGTNNAGQVGGMGDIGQFIVSRNDKPKFTRHANHYANVQDIRGGKFTLNSVDGGAFEAVTLIPFFEKGHFNVLDIKSNEKFNLEFNPDDDGTVFADLKIKVYGLINKSLFERYDYRMTGLDQTEGAAVDTENYPVNKDNVSALYFNDLDDIIDTLAFESNGRTVVGTTEWLALQGLTNANNRIEDATQDVVEIENHTPGVAGSLKSRNNNIIVTTTGAGSFDVTVCSVEPGPNFNLGQ